MIHPSPETRRIVNLPDHKTKIVCTIGPASSSEPVLEEMVRNGMDVARLNLSHGSFDEHRERIRSIRAAAANIGRSVTILLDLPGPKIRIGDLAVEPLLLTKGETVVLTVDPAPAPGARIPVDYRRFPEIAAKGSVIYLADGFLQLRVEEVSGNDVICTVVVGGYLYSRKGLNLVGSFPAIDAVTDHDLECIAFGLSEGLEIFGISFIERAEDIRRARAYAADLGREIHVVAKIERREALLKLDEILAEADGVMIARGDLGVQIPIEEVPSVQKRIIRRANILGRPVITATQMLESMTDNLRPTRAEVADVANAILDGTDAVMLSEETSVGRYPVETVAMMARIARATEGQRRVVGAECGMKDYFRSSMGRKGIGISDVVSLNVIEALEALGIRLILSPTRTGSTPRRISRFKPDAWILAFSRAERTLRFLAFSYGVHPILFQAEEERWHSRILPFVRDAGLAMKGERVILTQGISPKEPGTDSMTILTVD